MKKDESKDIVSGVSSSLIGILSAALTADVIGADPVAAGAMSYVSQVLGLGNKFKLRKADSFIVELSKYIKKINPEFDEEHVKSEDFQLFFESVIIKVTRSRTEEKRKRFRNIAFNQMVDPIDFDIADKYVDLTERLSDSQINLLSHFSINEPKYLGLDSDISRINEKLNTDLKTGGSLSIGSLSGLDPREKFRLENEKSELRLKLEFIQKSRQNLVDSNSIEFFDFYLNEMRSMGLVHLTKDGGDSRYSGMKAFRAHEITKLGQAFFNYIRDYEEK